MNQDKISKQSTEREHLKSSNLSALYPTPKTYDEILERQMRIDQVRLKRRPKLTLLSAGVILLFILAVLIDSVNISSKVIEAVGPVGGVFLLFLIGLALSGLALWQFQLIMRFFADRSMYGGWFVWLYLFSACAATWVYAVFAPDSSWAARLGIGAAQLVFMLLSAAIYLMVRRK